MAWIVASIPFWLLGIWCVFGAGYCLSEREPGETPRDQAWQALIGLTAAGMFLAIAAKLSS